MLGFIIAVAAGFLTPYADGPLSGPLIARAAPLVNITPTETRLVSFMTLMLIVGLLAMILHTGSSFWIVLGGIIGYFAVRVIDGGKRQFDRRKAARQIDAVNWKE